MITAQDIENHSSSPLNKYLLEYLTLDFSRKSHNRDISFTEYINTRFSSERDKSLIEDCINLYTEIVFNKISVDYNDDEIVFENVSTSLNDMKNKLTRMEFKINFIIVFMIIFALLNLLKNIISFKNTTLYFYI